MRGILIRAFNIFVLIGRCLLYVRSLHAIHGGGLQLFLLDDIVDLVVRASSVGLETLLEHLVVAFYLLLVVIYILHSNNIY